MYGASPTHAFSPPFRRGASSTASQSRMTDAARPVPSGTSGFSALIVAVAERGDREAFAALFDHYAPRGKCYLMRLGARSEAAEELAQETMVTLWRRAASFDPARAAASTWIFTIARNLRIDLARKEGRPAPVDDPAFEPPPPQAPDAALVAAEDGERIRLAMETLSADQAQAIRLAFFSDMTHSEIADSLGLPLGTVKSRLRLAMARLRARLESN